MVTRKIGDICQVVDEYNGKKKYQSIGVLFQTDNKYSIKLYDIPHEKKGENGYLNINLAVFDSRRNQNDRKPRPQAETEEEPTF